MIGGNMKNIIPFKKDIIFKTKLEEITSISLENTLKMIDGVVEGNFIIDGEYKEKDSSLDTEPFNLEIPFKSVMDERFITDKAIIDIDDFYYEITNDNTLSVSIDVLVDKLEEQPLIRVEDVKEEDIEEKYNSEEREIDEVVEEETKESNDVEGLKNKITTIFNTDNSEEAYVTYNVFIVRNNDTIDTILDKYKITKEELEKYNDLSELKVGDKLLIPNEYE